MKIGIIGGGAAGAYLAIRLKEKHPLFEVSIIEKNNALLKKIAVTGNGRCNYANLGSTINKYHNDTFANNILKVLPATQLSEIFEGMGIHPYQMDNLLYPVSLNAQTVILMLSKRINDLGIKVFLEEEFIDYESDNHGFKVKTSQDVHVFDRLIIASGGKAYPQLGTDGKVLDTLKSHNYNITPLSPSLSPIKVKENTKKISGQRVKCRVSLLNNNKLYYEEKGEVLFKDEGLSGIVVLNMSQKINELVDKSKTSIVLDLVDKDIEIKKEDYVQYVSPKVAQYLLDNNLDIHAVKYTFKSFYDFNIAEVTSGGLDINEVDEHLESKKEKGLYFAGEVLDVDGMCGGFNLMFAFASAEMISEHIEE